MHLQRIRAQNFRAFGDGKTAPQLDWALAPGLNILIGENDAGKTAVVDAIRHILWTTSYEFVRLFEQDFHIQGNIRAGAMFIEATLVDLSADQEAAVLEWLTYEQDGSRSLVLHLQARWIPPKDNKRGRVDVVKRPVQVVMTTHSPSLAAGADIASMTLVHRAQLYSLAHDKTQLKKSDYDFLRRFLDATKANLFFARGVAIVEGPAEALLLPAIAKACDMSFSRHGLAVVNVGGVGLYHYARILQRAKEDEVIPIPVACLTDRDVVPDAANGYITKPEGGKPRFDSDYTEATLAALVKSKVDRAAGGRTIVCVSDRWTFEFDLARHGCGELMFTAIQLAVKAQAKGERLDEKDEVLAMTEAHDAWEALAKAGHTEDELAALVYQPLATKKASKAVAAQYAAFLIETGNYGKGNDLFERLPPYLKRALNWLTGKAGAA